MAGRRLVSSKDLTLIRDCYRIPRGIILSAPELHETPRDHRSGHICLNESMLKAGVLIPFKFGIVKLMLGFRVASMRIIPHTWKIADKLIIVPYFDTQSNDNDKRSVTHQSRFSVFFFLLAGNSKSAALAVAPKPGNDCDPSKSISSLRSVNLVANSLFFDQLPGTFRLSSIDSSSKSNRKPTSR
ncbi:hypothetical protein ACLOJK_018830 [Asimina triloba]